MASIGAFDEYLRNNFAWRNGTVTELDFGSAAQNRAAAEEIELGPETQAHILFLQADITYSQTTVVKVSVGFRSG